MAASFRATGLPHAEDTLARAAGRLDGWFARWAGAHTAACEATEFRCSARLDCLSIGTDTLPCDSAIR